MAEFDGRVPVPKLQKLQYLFVSGESGGSLLRTSVHESPTTIVTY
jgi:hypothetical protein